MKETDDTYLSDWLADKITDAQLKQWVSEDDFTAYQKLRSALDIHQIENPDLEKNYNVVQQKVTTVKRPKQSKVIPLYKLLSIAASMVLLFGVYYFFIATNVVTTGFGDTKQVVLSDHSKVSLNAKSKLCYSNYFQYKRTLHLEGEAFFEVQKGSSFTVATPLGNVRVLGTKFNVMAFCDFFEVFCYEGKVEVTQKEKRIILTQGESIRFYGDAIENWAEPTAKKPTWLKGESSFTNVPIQYVIAKFKDRYNREVSYPKNIESIKFTGTFSNTDIDVALKTICFPLHLKYTKNDTGKIQISE